MLDISLMALKRDPLPREGLKPGEFIGWRIWEIHNLNGVPTIRSWVYPCFWLPGQIVSDLSYSEDSPCMDTGPIGDYNDRGVWAFKSQEVRDKEFSPDRVFAPNLIWGSCWMWGTIIEHELGFRSQYARIRTLDRNEYAGVDIDTLRARYGVERGR